MDWGEATEVATDIYGVKFAALNMANARKFGGGYMHGAGAQEENMFRRTISALNDEGVAGDGTYEPYMSDEIYGKTGMVPVFESVCFRKSEADRYAVMADHEIFPFYELRSAAQNLSGKHRSPFDPGRCRNQVLAQFAAIRDIGAQGAVLSAFGCGAFENPPDQVAHIYKKCISDPAVVGDDLKIILFAIIPNPNGKPDANYETFRDILQDSIPPTRRKRTARGIKMRRGTKRISEYDKSRMFLEMIVDKDWKKNGDWDDINELYQSMAYHIRDFIVGDYVSPDGIDAWATENYPINDFLRSHDIRIQKGLPVAEKTKMVNFLKRINTSVKHLYDGREFEQVF